MTLDIDDLVTAYDDALAAEGIDASIPQEVKDANPDTDWVAFEANMQKAKRVFARWLITAMTQYAKVKPGIEVVDLAPSPSVIGVTAPYAMRSNIPPSQGDIE